MSIREWAGICLAAQTACAGIVLEPQVERNFGTAHYDMDFPFPTQDFSGGSESGFSDAYGRSRLNFPLDVFLAGLRLESGNLDGSGSTFFASVKTAFSQPRQSMEDKDWLELRASNGTGSATAFVLFSDTDSRTRLDWWSGELGWEFPGVLIRGRRIRFGWRLGADYYSADIYGIKGWQGDKVNGTPGNGYVEFDTLQNEKVLTYRALYLSPGATASTHWLRGRSADLDLRLALSPATFARDADNHLIRGKKSESWAIGLDGSVEADLVWHWRSRMAIKLGALVGYTRTWGRMTQEFYGNTPEDADANRQLRDLGSINNSLGRFTYGIRLSTPITVSGLPRPETPGKDHAP
jgi:hypothetical protein